MNISTPPQDVTEALRLVERLQNTAILVRSPSLTPLLYEAAAFIKAQATKIESLRKNKAQAMIFTINE